MKGQNEDKGVVGGFNLGVWLMGVANYAPLKETLVVCMDLPLPLSFMYSFPLSLFPCMCVSAETQL